MPCAAQQTTEPRVARASCGRPAMARTPATVSVPIDRIRSFRPERAVGRGRSSPAGTPGSSHAEDDVLHHRPGGPPVADEPF
ncbi:hypothetical protein, partial [Streptomyces sp. NPDC001274]